MSGEMPIITATVSFGMGVDKASVRFVVHWCAPQGHNSIEKNLQLESWHGSVLGLLFNSVACVNYCAGRKVA